MKWLLNFFLKKRNHYGRQQKKGSVSAIALIVFIFRILTAVFIFVTADPVIAFAAIGTCCVTDQFCMDKLHSCVIRITKCRHNFKQSIFLGKFGYGAPGKFIINRFVFLIRSYIHNIIIPFLTSSAGSRKGKMNQSFRKSTYCCWTCVQIFSRCSSG